MRDKNLFLVTERYLASAVLAIGAFLITLAGTAVLGAWFYQLAGHREFDRVQASTEAAPARREVSRTLQNSRPAHGKLLAKLQVPRINMSVVVLEGSDDAVLKKGPGHVEETALPGELGNVAIAGHRDTHFRPLRNVRVNDEVILTTKSATLRYFIDTINIIPPTDMQILDPTPEAALTLITCYPFEFVGNAPMRYVIRATPRVGGAGGAFADAER